MSAPPSPSAPARLVIDSSYHPVAYKYGYGNVRLTIDGYEYRVEWGPAGFDLPPGQHQLEVRSSQINFGHTTVRTPVYLHPGQQLTLYYRAPASLFHSGTIGPTPPRSRGGRRYRGLVVVTIAGCAVMVGALTGLMLFAGR